MLSMMKMENKQDKYSLENNDIDTGSSGDVLAGASPVAGLSNNNNAKSPPLTIKFHKSLGLLSIQDILLLLRVCKDRNIHLPDINKLGVFDAKNAVDISTKSGNDCRLLEHARNAHGRPLLMSFADITSKHSINSNMIKLLCLQDFDVNLQDVSNGESIIFPLIRKFDNYTLKFLLTTFRASKNVFINLNYYNKAGVSPLFVALSLYKEEKQMISYSRMSSTQNTGIFDNNHSNNNNTTDNNDADGTAQSAQSAQGEQQGAGGHHHKSQFMYQILLSNNAYPNFSIKRATFVSPLAYAINKIGDLHVCYFVFLFRFLFLFL